MTFPMQPHPQGLRDEVGPSIYISVNGELDGGMLTVIQVAWYGRCNASRNSQQKEIIARTSL